MEKRRKKMGVLAKVVLSMALLFMVSSTNVASAGYMGSSAYYSTLACVYQGESQYFSAAALINNNSSYLYTAWLYMSYAFDATDTADYAAYLGYYNQISYNAYVYSMEAYDWFDAAEYYAYYAYVYKTTYYIYRALYNGGMGSAYAAISEYYAAMSSVGGNY